MKSHLRILRQTMALLVLAAIVFGLPLRGVGYASASSRSVPDMRNSKSGSCAVCPSQVDKDLAEKLATLGREAQAQARPLTPILRSVFEGMPVNFVNTATGNLTFQVSDLKLEGAQPIEFARIYDSSRSEDTGLGRGWSFLFDDRIKISGNTAVLTTGSGMAINFSREGGTKRFVLTNPEPISHQSFSLAGKGEIVEEVGEYVRVYRKIGPTYRLAELADRNGKKIVISFNARGDVRSVVTDAATALKIEWSGGKQRRITGVTDNTGRRVNFTHSDGLLRSVTDPVGARWTYSYESGLLKGAHDPINRTLLRAQYNQSGQVIAAGDAIGISTYEYDSAARVSPRTVVTDAMGRRWVYEHNELGAMTGMGDSSGNILSLRYNTANRPERISDLDANEIRFGYDAKNRLTQQTSPGVEKTFTYDERGAVASSTVGGLSTTFVNDERGRIEAAFSSDLSASYRMTRDESGQVLSITSEAGAQVSYEYDIKGNQTAYTYPGVGRFEQKFDLAGRKISERMPSGLSIEYKYDSRGLLVKQSDNKGHSMTMERDAGGVLVGLVSHDGNWVRVTRDEAGRIVTLNSSVGKSRHFVYDAGGSLIEYTNEAGKRSKMKYDDRGRLQSITDSDGVTSRYSYTRAGKLLGVTRDVRLDFSAMKIIPASFEPRGSASPALQFDCFFGTGGGFEPWFPGDSFYMDYGFGCGPYPGFEGGGGGGGFYYGGETCQQCINRQSQICNATYQSCLNTAAAAAFVAIAACAILTGPAAPLCVAAALAAQILASESCRHAANACNLGARDKCPQCLQ